MKHAISGCAFLSVDNFEYNGCLQVGEVPEWTIGTVSKTVVALWLPRVRIPPSPPKKMVLIKIPY